MVSNQDRLDAVRTALLAQASAGGAVKVREADGREVQYDLAWLRVEEARLAREVAAETTEGAGMFQRIRYRRVRG